jgi:hypothetical protein
MTIRAAFSWVLARWMGLTGLAIEANADVLVKAEKHPAGEYFSLTVFSARLDTCENWKALT